MTDHNQKSIEAEALEHVKQVGGNNACYDSYIAGRSKADEEKDKEISVLIGERDAFAYNADQYDKQLQESLLRIRELEEALREIRNRVANSAWHIDVGIVEQIDKVLNH